MSQAFLAIHRLLQETSVHMLIFDHFSSITPHLTPDLSETAYARHKDPRYLVLTFWR
jgi:hypothetical protein